MSLTPRGMEKVNMDARFEHAHKRASSRVVIRDGKGNILGACCRLTQWLHLSFVVKTITIIHGL